MIIYRVNPKLIDQIFYNKASSAENQIAAQQQSFYNTLIGSYTQQFANQSAILSSITNAFTPILQAGPGQFGFTPEETQAMRSNASEQVSQAYQGARIAQQNNLGTAGGGDAFIPSGAQAQLSESLSASAANQLATEQNQITQSGYEVGRENFQKAAAVLGGVSSQYNPAGYGGLAGNTATSAFNMANNINQQNNAWKGELAGILTGGITSFLSGGLSSILGGGGGGGGQQYSIAAGNLPINTGPMPTVPFVTAPGQG